MQRVFINSKSFDVDPYAIRLNHIKTARFCMHAMSCGDAPFAPFMFYPKITIRYDVDYIQEYLAMVERWLEVSKEIWTLTWWIPANEQPQEMLYLSEAAKHLGIPERRFIINNMDGFTETTLMSPIKTKGN